MANLRIKMTPIFPSTVTGRGGISATKESGHYFIEPKWDGLTLDSNINPNEMEVWVRNSTTGEYVRVTLKTLIGEINVPIFVQDTAPSSDSTEGSIWIDTDSNTLDVYQLVAGTWTDTGADLKGPQGDQPRIFVQDSEPDTTDVPEDSLWIDSDSSNNDLYQLQSGAWVDTGVNLKGTSGAGTGDVVGPESSTNNSLARFDGADGKLLKDGAIIGVDVQAYDSDTAKTDTAQSWSATQTFLAAIVLQAAKEKITRTASAATGTVNFDWLTQSILHYTNNASANFTLNVRGDGSNTLNSLMSIGQVVTATFKATQGGTAYYMSAVNIDGTASGVTVLWPDGDNPTSGSPNSIDVYRLDIEKTADATFTVEASVVSMAA